MILARRTAAAACLVAALFLLAPAAQAGGPDPDRLRTEALTAAYARAKGWPVKALVLLALGTRWHPAGAEIVLDALESKDPHLKTYAIEALRSTPPEHLRCVLVPDLVDELVERQIRERNARVRLNLLLVMARAFPDAQARKPGEWRRWWRAIRETYQPVAWEERAAPDQRHTETKTVAPTILDRAFDLSEAGMQVVLVVDSTGSMQPTINAVKEGITDVVAVLSSVASDFELGLVHYRDYADFPGRTGEDAGAEVLARLTRSVSKVHAKLDRMVAYGGGDWQERVVSGMSLAMDRKMGWKPGANKMVIVIGDAPPHRTEAAVELARRGRKSPRSLLTPSRRVVTAPDRAGRKKPRPFVTSTVPVGARGGPIQQTSSPFGRIAKAGGGACAPFTATGDNREVTANIVRRLVELSFGARYVEEARRLVDIYFLYRDAGFIPK